MSKMKTSLVLMGVLLSGGIVGTATAHHSVAAFDRANPVALSGTVKEFKYTNPHTWIYLMVPDGKGGEQQWDLEGGSVNMVVRQGWTKDTLKQGMKVKLRIAPRKDGAPGGEWLSVIEVDGKPLDTGKE
ncbi:MAG: DUF6152 family protein [Steroidobacteraceae bacterium]